MNFFIESVLLVVQTEFVLAVTSARRRISRFIVRFGLIVDARSSRVVAQGHPGRVLAIKAAENRPAIVFPLAIALGIFIELGEIVAHPALVIAAVFPAFYGNLEALARHAGGALRLPDGAIPPSASDAADVVIGRALPVVMHIRGMTEFMSNCGS